MLLYGGGGASPPLEVSPHTEGWLQPEECSVVICVAF